MLPTFSRNCVLLLVFIDFPFHDVRFHWLFCPTGTSITKILWRVCADRGNVKLVGVWKTCQIIYAAENGQHNVRAWKHMGFYVCILYLHLCIICVLAYIHTLVDFSLERVTIHCSPWWRLMKRILVLVMFNKKGKSEQLDT